MQFTLAIVILGLFALALGNVSAAPGDIRKYLPIDNLPKCSSEEKQLSECLKNIFNIIVPSLKDGIPELKILPYEPFLLNRTSFEYKNGPVNGRVTIQNTKLYGFGSAIAKDLDLKMDKDKIKLRIITNIPKLNIVGKYKADLNINSLHLQPKGDFNVSLVNVESVTVTEGEIFKKDGMRYVKLTDIDSDPKIGDLSIKANGIFGDPELDEIALNVASQYWREIYSVMLPETRPFWQPLMLRLFNDALELVPLDEFLKDET